MMQEKESQEDLSGGNLYDPPNDKYKKFFDKFKEYKTLNISNWKPVHLLGYFCDKYKEHYGSDYKFKFNSPKPTSCYEIFQIKKLGNILSSDPKILKEYIDWVFKTRVKEAKKKLTSIGFMTVEGLLTEYKVILMSGMALNRSSSLPEELKLIFPKLNTYGDLAFYYHSIKSDKNKLNEFLMTMNKFDIDENKLIKII